MKTNVSQAEKMLDIILAFYDKKDYNDLLEFILDKMMELTNADAGTLYVLDDEALHFRIMRTISLNIYSGVKDEINLPPIIIDKSNIQNICAYTAIKNEIVNIEDVYNNAAFNFSGPKKYDAITGYRTRSMLVFPLSSHSAEGGEEVIGVIQLINSIDEKTGEVRPFAGSENDLLFLRTLSNISSNALSNLQQAKEIKELFDSFIKVMTKAIDERSPYNVNHTNNVARYCGDFAKYLRKRFPAGHELHFNEAREEKLVMAALLHDIGKIITPIEIMDKPNRLYRQMEIISYKFFIKALQLELDCARHTISEETYNSESEALKNALALIREINGAGFLNDEKIERVKELALITYIDENGVKTPILTDDNMDALTVKKGTLTNGERKTMEEHALVTGRLLAQMSFKKHHKEVPIWAKSHHEYIDGSGYPLGLSDGQVAVETRILSIMDIYDALTASDRPYKESIPTEKAFGILSSMAEQGKLNHELVALFIESGVGDLLSEQAGAL